jgi:NAD-dependent SIR2 family protein deacetylase
LATCIKDGKQVVFITGAGLSVASGVRAFRTTNDSSRYFSNHDAWKSRDNNQDTGGKKKSTGSNGKNKGLVEEQPLGIWNSTLWTQAKRETFRKDPLHWWNEFWLRCFPVEDYENKYYPNAGHKTIALLQQAFPDNVKVITQNVDGLQHAALDSEELDRETTEKLTGNIIEAHGRLGLYKCIPADDSDTDSSSDEDDDRLVHLGHRRKYRAWKRKYHAQTTISMEKGPLPEVPCAIVATDVSSGSSSSDTRSCQYQMLKSLMVDQLGPTSIRKVLKSSNRDEKPDAGDNKRLLTAAPSCPDCGNSVLPQALLFDEGYHSHEHYNFTKMEDWLASAEALVFIGTSFAVTLPLVALDHAREMNIPVYNFNLSDMLESTSRLNAENIMGPSQETLPKLWQAVQYLQLSEKKGPRTS